MKSGETVTEEIVTSEPGKVVAIREAGERVRVVKVMTTVTEVEADVVGRGNGVTEEGHGGEGAGRIESHWGCDEYGWGVHVNGEIREVVVEGEIIEEFIGNSTNFG